jgi:glucokinase
MATLLEGIPVWVILNDRAALLGAGLHAASQAQPKG